MIETIKSEIKKSCTELAWPPVPFIVERPRDPSFGHVSSNVALLLSKSLKRSPREIAEILMQKMWNTIPGLDKIEIAGAGFLNFTFSSAYLQSVITRIRKEGPDFQRDFRGKGKKVQVEFVSANPTGPLTIGHGRQAVLGDSIA
ncbi:MAG: arginine--tRNA ligase, partial [Methanomicrobiales archaeon]|nr:arginine--tRNA ligase [Methanomicrobiales archaeon]